MSEKWFDCQFISSQRVGQSYILLQIKPQTVFDFRSGQYVKLALAGNHEASLYLSIASSPQNRQILEFCLQIQTQSPIVQSLISNARPNFTVSAPMGKFSIVDRQKPIHFIAGGSGIAPIRSFLKDFSPQVVTQSVRLIYGCKTAKAIPYHDELIEMEKKYSQFQLYFVTESDAKNPVHSGRVIDLLDRFQDLVDFDHYVCGPPAMVHLTKAKLINSGVAASRIFYDG